MNRHKKIKLIGSTRFKPDFIYWAKHLTGIGFSVSNLKLYSSKEDEDLVKKMGHGVLHSIHCQELEEADLVFVINKNGYIGEGLKVELSYCNKLNKTIYYLEGENTIKANEEILTGINKNIRFDKYDSEMDEMLKIEAINKL